MTATVEYSLVCYGRLIRMTKTKQESIVGSRPAASSGPIGVVDATGSYHKEEKERGRRACCGYYYGGGYRCHRDLAHTRRSLDHQAGKTSKGEKKGRPDRPPEWLCLTYLLTYWSI